MIFEHLEPEIVLVGQELKGLKVGQGVSPLRLIGLHGVIQEDASDVVENSLEVVLVSLESLPVEFKGSFHLLEGLVDIVQLGVRYQAFVELFLLHQKFVEELVFAIQISKERFSFVSIRHTDFAFVLTISCTVPRKLEHRWHLIDKS